MLLSDWSFDRVELGYLSGLLDLLVTFIYSFSEQNVACTSTTATLL